MMKVNEGMEKAIMSMKFEIGFYHFNDGTEGFIYDTLEGSVERVDFNDGYFMATSESVKQYLNGNKEKASDPIEMMMKMFEF